MGSTFINKTMLTLPPDSFLVFFCWGGGGCQITRGLLFLTTKAFSEELIKLLLHCGGIAGAFVYLRLPSKFENMEASRSKAVSKHNGVLVLLAKSPLCWGELLPLFCRLQPLW